jgi:hypothetical protein
LQRRISDFQDVFLIIVGGKDLRRKTFLILSKSSVFSVLLVRVAVACSQLLAALTPKWATTTS